MPPALGVQSASHWTTREVPGLVIFKLSLKGLQKTVEIWKKCFRPREQHVQKSRGDRVENV